MFVATTTLRWPAGVGSNTCCCCCGGSVENSGKIYIGEKARRYDQIALVFGERLRLLLQTVAGVQNLLLARQEQKDVAGVLQQVDLR